VNWGQCLTPLGDGRYAIRSDVLPAFSVLALEVRRWHAAYPPDVSITPQPAMGRPELGPGERAPEKPLADRVLEAVRDASRKGLRLRSAEICEKVKASRKAKHVVKALRKLRAQGLIEREGKTLGATYAAVNQLS